MVLMPTGLSILRHSISFQSYLTKVELQILKEADFPERQGHMNWGVPYTGSLGNLQLPIVSQVFAELLLALRLGKFRVELELSVPSLGANEKRGAAHTTDFLLTLFLPPKGGTEGKQ